MTQKVFSLQRFWQARADSAKLFAQVEVAQLAARRSRNPKVGSSILSCRSWLLLCKTPAIPYRPRGGVTQEPTYPYKQKKSSRGTLYSVSAGARMIITRSNLAQDQQTQIHKVRAQKHAHQKPHNELIAQPRAPRAKSPEPRTKSQESRVKIQEPRAKSQEPHKRRRKRKRTQTHRGMFALN